MGYQTMEVPITYPSFDSTALAEVSHTVGQHLDGQYFDLIHVHHMPAAMVGHMLSTRWGVPLLLNIDSPFLRPPYRAFIEFTQCYVVSASRSGYDNMLALGITPPEQLFVVQPGVDLADYRPPSAAAMSRNGTCTFGTAARLVKDKGVDRLIRAMCHLNANTRLMIAGTGHEEARLQALVDELDLQGRVQFLGELNPEDMPAFYQRLDAFVLPTHREGCPITVLEAIASGVPVVATAVGDVPYLVQAGENGYTINAPEPEVIAEQIRKVIEAPGFAQRTRRYNRELIADFDHVRQAYRMLDVYSRITRDGDG
jgi:glycosyltransferase involved in cell wall biosynthesis